MAPSALADLINGKRPTAGMTFGKPTSNSSGAVAR
jgi:hypothetical protein